MSAHIAVIGAGIAGLATAVALRGTGLDVTVIEQRTDTATGAGISIWPNAGATAHRFAVRRPSASSMHSANPWWWCVGPR